LGEVLFTDPGVRRGPVAIARIAAGQRLHQRAFAGFAEPPDTIWGRRSICSYRRITHCWSPRFSYPICRRIPRRSPNGFAFAMNIEPL
jgi:hypothetical protein